MNHARIGPESAKLVRAPTSIVALIDVSVATATRRGWEHVAGEVAEERRARPTSAATALLSGIPEGRAHDKSASTEAT